MSFLEENYKTKNKKQSTVSLWKAVVGLLWNASTPVKKNVFQ
jgi:hypothetical protein